jgi:hypothetical protein
MEVQGTSPTKGNVIMSYHFSNRIAGFWFARLLCVSLAPLTAHAQMTDQTQAPNVERAGILKSLQQQVGAGVGDIATPDHRRTSSRAIRRDRSGAAASCSSASSRSRRAWVRVPATASATSAPRTRSARARSTAAPAATVVLAVRPGLAVTWLRAR